jgi:hypothetical protein
MAGTPSYASRRVSPSRPIRRFTLAQANSTLPLVKRIVADVVRLAAEAAGLRKQVEQTTDAKKQASYQKELDERGTRMHQVVEELTVIGVELKDPNIGLIDFIGRHQGRDVYLCWKLGEESITHWHDLQAGFAGRQPISSLEEDAD